MYKIDEFNKSDLLYMLKCKGLSPCIIYDKLVVFNGEKIVFAKKLSDLFFNDLVALGITVCDDRYVHYLVDIARDNSKGKRKSLRL